MIQAVFISDLHLNPQEPMITKRFLEFLAWLPTVSRTVYILGDFFHAWPGDDGIDDWCKEIAKKMKILQEQGIVFYYMHGNRDFLLGQRFAHLAGWKILEEPAQLDLGQEKILLVHGDRYCTKDLGHQRFRRLTRNKLFKSIFLRLPLNFRMKLVQTVRNRSKNNRDKPIEVMDAVEESFLEHMQKCKVDSLIHGHTHKPGSHVYSRHGETYHRYVLSDWDDVPEILCYDNTKGFYFTHILKD